MKSLFWAAVLILVLNLVDGMLTLAVVQGGLAAEANPLLDAALTQGGAAWFMAVKLALVSLGVGLLWRLRHRRSALIALASGAAVYSGLLITHHARSVSALAHYLASATGPWT
jgi:hypothetical protein